MSRPVPDNLILLCEPQIWGFGHAPFNAALLQTVRLAFPEASIRFLGEGSHLEEVRNIYQSCASANYSEVEWQEIMIPEARAAGWNRLPAEFSACRHLLTIAQRSQARLLIFCSISAPGLLALKTLMLGSRFAVPTLAVPHACLGALLERSSRRPWNWLLGLRNILALPHPRSLRLIALGDSIYRWVQKLQPGRATQWAVLDHPYLWPAAGGESALLPESAPIRFGAFGVASKNLSLFSRLAEELGPRYPQAEFHLVGFLNSSRPTAADSKYLRGLSERPLTRAEFSSRAQSLTYAVWTADPQHYRLVASASFLDALASLKPGIYLRNSYVEYYFERMGDIGYLCDSYEELRDAVIRIVEDFPRQRYQQQIENIRKGRSLFAPEFLASRLQTIVSQGPAGSRTVAAALI